jgi:putative FmdB family regulatory protein
MPTYEYTCKSCGEHIEVVQSFKDGPLTECPSCGGSLRKVFGNIGIVFKGSGFYKTDNRASSKASQNTKSESESKAESKSESSAPATKAASDSGSTASAESKGSSAKVS